jgi:hypothetical protein
MKNLSLPRARPPIITFLYGCGFYICTLFARYFAYVMLLRFFYEFVAL